MDNRTVELFSGKKLEMLQMFEEGFERGGDKAFALYQRADGTREEVSYNTIKKEGLSLAEKLKKAGLVKGDRVAVVSAMRPWWYSVEYACLKGGYIMVCIDPGVAAAQIQGMLRQTEVRAVFTTQAALDLPDEISGRVPVYSVEAGFPVMNGVEKVDFLLDSCSGLPEETFYILFSSGTTGETRKGVLLKHETITKAIEYNMATDTGVYKNESPYTPRDRDLMLFPPYHVAGLLCSTYDLYCNTQVIMLERLTPNALVGAMQELKPDNICTVPSMLTSLKNKIVSGYSGNIFLKLLITMLLAVSGFLREHLDINAGRVLLSFLNKKAFGGNMKGFMIGASPCDEETNRFFLNMGIDMAMAYGLTELGAPLAVTGKGYYPGTTGRVPRHADDIDIRIVNPDETGRGEVEVLSPYRMISYLRDKDMDGVFTKDGYFRTGDLGYFDEKQCLVICGRAKDTIVLRNGEKLLPEEVEEKYQKIDAVNEVSVFRVPDDNGCDAFSIAVTPVKARSLPDESIRMRVLDRAATLPAMYRPKEVYVLKEFPLSSSHKVQRFRLTEMAVNGASSPVTEASMKAVNEDTVSAELRAMLVTVGGPQWKTAELTEGLLLNLDSLQAIDLLVAIQEKFGIDLFRLSSQPETFGALVDAVKNYDKEDKTERTEIDLSAYPQPMSVGTRLLGASAEKLVKMIWNVHAKGKENIPTDGNFLIWSNHRTVLDPGFICACLPSAVTAKTCIVGKSEVGENKAMKEFARSHNYIPIDRSGNFIPTLDRCRELLKEDWNILIFPEGTNYNNNEVMFPFKEGPARLAIASGKPVLPVHISGLAHMDAEMTEFTLPPTGGRVQVAFGKPISPKGQTVESLNALMRSAIEALD